MKYYCTRCKNKHWHDDEPCCEPIYFCDTCGDELDNETAEIYAEDDEHICAGCDELEEDG